MSAVGPTDDHKHSITVVDNRTGTRHEFPIKNNAIDNPKFFDVKGLFGLHLPLFLNRQALTSPVLAGTLNDTDCDVSLLNGNGSNVRFFSIRWDGDKVRGIKVDWQDASVPAVQVGGYGDTGYSLSSYTFTSDERLKTFIVRDSGYGHGTLRNLEFSTDRPDLPIQAWGQGGFDNEVSCRVAGLPLAGFKVRLQDNYIKNIQVYVYNE